ncbi:exopolysaccharide biosynthesis protein [Novispirillum sp. DQ9]|uniref:exopolysaccharide biosynthesis protein n=1 Tax=Novispirillum sp. DQ9 TaxID=3398612 RepID=UPI003C7D3CA8
MDSDAATRRPPVSALLADLAATWPEPRIRLGALAEVLSDRAYGPLLLIFALPNVLPAPPGLSAVLGVPLVLTAAQLALGRHRPWLPGVVRERSLRTEDFAAFVARGTPWLQRVERLLKPRLRWVTRFAVERLVAALCLVLAVIIMLPIPFGNMLPALSISITALGLFERDGLVIAIGTTLGLASLTLLAGLALGAAGLVSTVWS